jgi:hypothetical protein
MKHEIISLGTSFPLFHSPFSFLPYPSLSLKLINPDLTETKIFQACAISYVVKNDPENKILRSRPWAFFV